MDSLTVTIIAIVLVTFLSAFIKGRKKDRCLKKIDGYFIQVFNSKIKTIWGKAEIESNTIVIDFESNETDAGKKFILYKSWTNSSKDCRRLDEQCFTGIISSATERSCGINAG